MPAAVAALLVGAFTCVAAWVLPASALAATGWLPAEKIATEGSTEVAQAVGPTGEVLALDDRLVAPSEYRIQVRVRPPGGSFSSPELISPSGSNAEEPEGSIDAHGNAIVVWRHGNLIEYSLRPAGGTFEKPHVVSGESESTSFGTHVVMTPSGEAIVSWVGRTAGFTPPFTETVRAAALAPGAHSFGPTQAVTSMGPYNPSEQMDELRVSPLAVDGKGDVYLLANSVEEVSGLGGHTTSQLHVFERPPSGTFGAGTLITAADKNSIEEFQLDSPRVAAGRRGDAVVTWHKDNIKASTSRIEASVQPAGGAFEGPGAVEDVSGERKNVIEPTAAVAATGAITVAFIGEDLSSKRSAVLEVDRPAGGAFGTIETVSDPSLEPGTYPPEFPRLGVGPSGEEVLLWSKYDEPSRIEASTRPASGSFGAQQTISATGKSGTIAPPLLDFDEAGDAVASWRSSGVQEWTVHDISGPALSGLSLPASAVAGTPATFSVTALDTFSPPLLTEWSFGDGGTGAGPSTTHTYAKAGTYTVTVKSTDALGNASTTGGSIVVAAALPGPSAPKLSSLSQAHKTWRTGRALAAIASTHRPPIGTSFSFKLDQAAEVKLTFRQAASGKRVKGRCVAPTHRNRRARRCVRTLTRGTLTLSGHAGVDKVSFQGKVSAKSTLPPGAYTVTFIATNAAGLNSAAVHLTFQIVR